jgi:hypothetical protein
VIDPAHLRGLYRFAGVQFIALGWRTYS